MSYTLQQILDSFVKQLEANNMELYVYRNALFYQEYYKMDTII